jgi:hypothetical protein
MNNREKLRKLEKQRDLLAGSIYLLKQKFDRQEIGLTDYQSLYAIKKVPKLEQEKLSSLNKQISLIRESLRTRPKTNKPYALVAFVILGLVLMTFFIGQPNITGLFTFQVDESFTLPVNEVYSSNSSFEFNQSLVSSVKVNGLLTYSDDYIVKVILETSSGNFTILDKTF